MKYVRYILLPFLLLLAFAACTQDEAQTDVPGEIKLLLNIPGATQSKSITAEAGESTITNVYLLFYAQTASDTDTPAFFHSATGLSAEGNWSTSLKTTQMPGLEANITYDVYVIASLPASVAPPTEATTKDELLNIQETMSDQPDINNWTISFSGTSTYTGGTLGELKINLRRMVARVEVQLTSSTSAQNLTLQLVEAPASSFYLKEKTENTLTNYDQQIPPESSNNYRFYLYEHASGNQPVSLYVNGTTVSGESISHRIELQPEGSSQFKRNYIYKFTVTVTEGDITVSAGKTLDWSEAVAETPAITDIIIQPSSNTYILAPGSKTIGIPVNRPNLANAVNSAIPVINAGEELEAELVWTDVKSSSTNKGLAADASIANIKIIGNGPDACLLVTSGSQPGNSVVAVREKGGGIKWSWQIWVTDYNPEITNATTGGYTFMDRNIGALNNSTGQPYTIGTYYQWGRFQPFPTKKEEVIEFVPIYNAAGNQVSIQGNVTVSNIGELISQPLACANRGYNAGSDLWAAGKTVFDPCPAGWCVPSTAAWERIYSVKKQSDGFIDYFTNIFFPITWCVSSTGAISSTLEHGYHWSYNKNNDNEMYYKFMNPSDDAIQNFTTTPEWGFPVRCMKQTN